MRALCAGLIISGAVFSSVAFADQLCGKVYFSTSGSGREIFRVIPNAQFKPSGFAIPLNKDVATALKGQLEGRGTQMICFEGSEVVSGDHKLWFVYSVLP